MQNRIQDSAVHLYITGYMVQQHSCIGQDTKNSSKMYMTGYRGLQHSCPGKDSGTAYMTETRFSSTAVYDKIQGTDAQLYMTVHSVYQYMAGYRYSSTAV